LKDRRKAAQKKTTTLPKEGFEDLNDGGKPRYQKRQKNKR